MKPNLWGSSNLHKEILLQHAPPCRWNSLSTDSWIWVHYGIDTSYTKKHLSSVATCEVWLVYQRGNSLQKVQLIKLIKDIPRWRLTEGKQAAALVPGIFKLHSPTPSAHSLGCVLCLGQIHVWEKSSPTKDLALPLKHELVWQWRWLQELISHPSPLSIPLEQAGKHKWYLIGITAAKTVLWSTQICIHMLY